MKLVKDVDQVPKKEHKISDEKAEEAVRTIIQWIGEDPSREGLISTPKRVIKAFKEYFGGYSQDPNKYLSKTFCIVLEQVETSSLNLGDSFTYPQNVCGPSRSQENDICSEL